MFGFGAFAELPFCDVVAIDAPTPVVVIDTHDGDERQKKRFQKEVEANDKKKAELKSIYEKLVEGKPQIAEEIAAPYMVVTESVSTATVTPVIDYDRMLSSIDTVEKLYRAFQEFDDEEVLLLI